MEGGMFQHFLGTRIEAKRPLGWTWTWMEKMAQMILGIKSALLGVYETFWFVEARRRGHRYAVAVKKGVNIRFVS